MSIPPPSPKCQAVADPVQVTASIRAAVNRHFGSTVLKPADDGSTFFLDHADGFTLNNAKNPPIKEPTRPPTQCEVKHEECLAFLTTTPPQSPHTRIGFTTIRLLRSECCPDATWATGMRCRAEVALPKESVQIFPPERITILQLALFGMSPEEHKRGIYSSADRQAARQLRSALGLPELCSLLQSI